MPVSAEMLALNLYVGLASPLIGSGIAAATARMVNRQAWGRRWGLAPSSCAACGRRLRAWEMAPVLSRAAQGGRCRGCGGKISRHYPLVELAAVGVAVWAALVVPLEVYIATCALGWLLVALSAVDIRTRRLPDSLNLVLAATGLGVAAVLDGTRLLAHVLGGVVGFASLVAIEIAYRCLRGRNGLGRGDAKLLGAIGAWVGPQGLIACIFVAASSGIILVLTIAAAKRRAVSSDTAISFGPFLALGGWLTWLYGPLVF